MIMAKTSLAEVAIWVPVMSALPPIADISQREPPRQLSASSVGAGRGARAHMSATAAPIARGVNWGASGTGCRGSDP